MAQIDQRSNYCDFMTEIRYAKCGNKFLLQIEKAHRLATDQCIPQSEVHQDAKCGGASGLPSTTHVQNPTAWDMVWSERRGFERTHQ